MHNKTQQQQVQQAPDKAAPPSTQEVHQPHPDKHSGPTRVARAAKKAGQPEAAAPERAHAMNTVQRTVGNARAGEMMRATDVHQHEPPASDPGEHQRDNLNTNSD